MLRSSPVAAITLAALYVGMAAACGSNSSHLPEPDAPPSVDRVLEIRLTTTDFHVIDGVAGDAGITVVEIAADGSENDITEEVTLTAEPAGIGTISGAVFAPSGAIAGMGRIVAFDGVFSTTAAIEVFVTQTIPGDVSVEDAALFQGASEDSSQTLTVVYPPSGALIPPNLGEMELHWTDPAAKTIYQVAFKSAYVELVTYATSMGITNWRVLSAAHWRLLSSGARGVDLAIEIKGLSTNAPATFVKGSTAVRIAAQEVLGGVYYWNTALAAIMRYDMATPDVPAERFYPSPNPEVAGDTGCVGCHAVSRDGTLVAYRKDGGNMNYANLLEVESMTRKLANNTQRWNFASIHPNNQDLFTTAENGLSRTDIATGEVSLLYGQERVSQPDTSPDGNSIVATTFGAGNEVYALQGRIVVFDYDQVAKTVGQPRTLVDPDGTASAFYPSISPDNQWVLYNWAPNEDSYDNKNAELWVVRLDGSSPPQRLSQADTPNTAFNSWPKWTPFMSMEPTLEGGMEPVMWFTVASRRTFGVRSGGSQKPQLWLAPFYPQRAAAGLPASAPPVRLPFQDLAQGNHIAQWTEAIIAVN